MNAHITDTEPTLASEVLDMATWNRPRSTEELLSFISRRHESIGDVELGL